jgi:hypothetical protein
MNDVEMLQAAVETMAQEAAAAIMPFRAAVLTAAADAIECWRTGKPVPEPRVQPEGAPAARAGLKPRKPRKTKDGAPPPGDPPAGDPPAPGGEGGGAPVGEGGGSAP